ncbi:FmdB family zinc ribbon protein [Nitrospira sp. Kam-Ns4a]
MPMSEYQCLDCGKAFLLVLTLKEHERGDAVCPACGSKRVKQLRTDFIARTAKKS